MNAREKRKIGSLITKVEKIRIKVGENRDYLEMIVREARSLIDTIEDADECLGRAIDALSEQA